MVNSGTVRKVRRSVQLESEGGPLRGELAFPRGACGLMVFATGTSGARHATLESTLAHVLHRHGVGTLVVDLLSPEESADRSIRSNVDVLSGRLDAQLDWLDDQDETAHFDVAFCGADTGAAVVLKLLSEGGCTVEALVLLNGRVDLAQPFLPDIQTPVLFVLAGTHSHLVESNRAAYENIDVQSNHKRFLNSDTDGVDPCLVARWVASQFSLSSEQKPVRHAGRDTPAVGG